MKSLRNGHVKYSGEFNVNTLIFSHFMAVKWAVAFALQMLFTNKKKKGEEVYLSHSLS